jgi:hypothetical protein
MHHDMNFYEFTSVAMHAFAGEGSGYSFTFSLFCFLLCSDGFIGSSVSWYSSCLVNVTFSYYEIEMH